MTGRFALGPGMTGWGPWVVLAILYLAVGSVVVVLAAQDESRPLTVRGTFTALALWPVVLTVAVTRIARGRPRPWL